MADETYTPTTGAVCAAYQGGNGSDWSDVQQMARQAQFDRWLAEHDAQVAANALRDAADEWPEDMTRGESQNWLNARADAMTRQADAPAADDEGGQE